MIGSNQEILEWATTNGATSTQWNTALMQACISLGGSAGSLPDMLNAMLIAKGYSGTVSDMWGQLYVDEIAGGGGGPPAGLPITGDYTLFVDESGGGYGDFGGGGLTPSAMFWMPDGTTLLGFNVNSSGTLLITTNGDEKWQSEIRVTFPSYSATPIRCINDDAGTPGYERWRANGETALWGYLQGNLGGSVNVTIDVDGNGLDSYTTNDHYIRVMDISATTRGFNALVSPGTYDPGTISPEFHIDTLPTPQPIKHFRVSSAGLVTLDNEGTSGTGTNVDLTVPGYNGDVAITLPWVSSDWRLTGHTALYTYFGTILDTVTSIKLEGPY